MLPRSTFGWRLRALRQARGISQVELAKRIGRHQTVIGPYERDEYEPPREVVEKLAVVLETSPEYLYFGRSPQQAVLPVAGQLDRAGLLEPLAESGTDLISLRDSQLRAYRLLDDAMAPVYRPQQIVLTLAVATDDDAGRGPDPLRSCRLQRAFSTLGIHPFSASHRRRAMAGSLARSGQSRVSY